MTPLKNAEVFQQYPELPYLHQVLEHRAQGFCLYFVRCNLPVVRKTLVDTLKLNLSRPVVEITIQATGEGTVDAQITEIAENSPENALLFIYHLESLLASEEHHVLQELNWRRTAYSRLKRPFVFWLPNFALDEIAEDAPDFFDWYSGIYQFKTPENQQAELIKHDIEQIRIYGTNPYDNLSQIEQKQRVGILKSLLEETTDNAIKAQQYHLLGVLYASLNEPANAENYYRHCSAINPQHELAWYNLGNALYKQGKLDEAIAAYQKQLVINPQDESAWNNLGIALQIQGKLDEAIAAYQKQLAINPQHESAWYNLGNAYWKKGDTQQAQQAFSKQLKINPDDISTLSNDAELALIQNDNRRCCQRLDKALSLVDNKAQEYVILPFLAWLADADQPYHKVLTACQTLEPSVKIDWDFSDIEPAIQRLSPEQQSIARQFIGYFQGKNEPPKYQGD